MFKDDRKKDEMDLEEPDEKQLGLRDGFASLKSEKDLEDVLE